MMRENFPNSSVGAKLYGGHMFNNTRFFKLYDMKPTFEECIAEINEFLDKNGYTLATKEEFEEDHSYDRPPVRISPHGYQEQFVLFIDRDEVALPQSGFIINELKKFRDERDWEQFHNPKDLAIALSIEANELLEQFLWKKHEEGDKEKIKEELADVFSFALLLADKYDFDIETIILEKIKTNAEKYPIDKSKGTAKKYNEL